MTKSSMSRQPRAYFVVITTTLFLLVTNQILIQYWLFQKADDALMVNLAGRQRMLSQRIALLSVLDQQNPGSQSEELSSTIQLWDDTHQQFVDPASDLSLEDETEVYEKIVALNPYFEWVKSNHAPGISAPPVTETVAQMEAFLLAMDEIVKGLEEISEDRLWFISRAELFLMVLTMAVFLVDILLISRPFIKKILRQSDQFESIAWVQSHMVRSPNAKIQGLISILENNRQNLSESEVQHYLALIEQECKRLDEMTQQVVEMCEN